MVRGIYQGAEVEGETLSVTACGGATSPRGRGKGGGLAGARDQNRGRRAPQSDALGRGPDPQKAARRVVAQASFSWPVGPMHLLAPYGGDYPDRGLEVTGRTVAAAGRRYGVVSRNGR